MFLHSTYFILRVAPETHYLAKKKFIKEDRIHIYLENIFMVVIHNLELAKLRQKAIKAVFEDDSDKIFSAH